MIASLYWFPFVARRFGRKVRRNHTGASPVTAVFMCHKGKKWYCDNFPYAFWVSAVLPSKKSGTILTRWRWFDSNIRNKSGGIANLSDQSGTVFIFPYWARIRWPCDSIVKGNQSRCEDGDNHQLRFKSVLRVWGWRKSATCRVHFSLVVAISSFNSSSTSCGRSFWKRTVTRCAFCKWFSETFHDKKCRLMRGDAVAACGAHIPEVVGSIPTPRN